MKTSKTHLKRTLVILLICLMGIAKAMAQSFTVGDLNYSVNSDSTTVTVTGHVDGIAATGSLVIPESVTYEGMAYTVTTVGNYAFSNCNGFTGGLTIGNSITSIGDNAFYSCSGFAGGLTIGNSVTSIGNYAFYFCSGFSELHYNAVHCADVNPIDPPFYGCGGTLIIGEGVERIPASVFSACGFTGVLTIPNSVTSIGNYAFQNCSGFTGSLNIPNSVTTISDYAFRGCSGFTSVTIPNSVTSIGSYSFYGCSGLTSVTIPNSVTSISSNAFYGCSGLTSIEIPNSVTSIGSFAFSSCTGLTSIEIPNSVTSIGSSAFSSCTGLTFIEIPNSVTSIGSFAFSGCSGLTSMSVLAETPPLLSYKVFFNVPKYIPVYVPIGTIGAYQNADGWNEFTNYQEIETPVPPTVYISDGLIMYLDGIYNTRNGHSTTTDVWEDLIGNYDLTVSNYSSYSWEDNHFIGLGDGGYLNTGHTWQYFNSLNDDITFEIVTYIDCDKTSPSYRGLVGWHSGNDGTNCQNDQGSGRMQTLGKLPVSDADDQIATVSYTRNNGSFLNGSWKTNANTIPSGINSNQTVVFGNSWAQCRGWNDSIYCIRMYNRSLTPEEVAYNHSIDIIRFNAGNNGISPLGEFTYMTPTDNYPFTFLPIVFSWDAVTNAQYYDLYLWNANDPMPEEPFVSRLNNGYYSCASLPNHQTYQWYVEAYNPYDTINSNIRTFTLDVEQALNVSTNNIDFGEVALNQSESMTLNVNGIALEDNLTIELVGDDASMFSFATETGWDDYSGGTITVTFQPTATQWEYHAALLISSGEFAQYVTLLGSVADVYVFNTYVEEEVYAMNTAIPIHGSVVDNENAPVTHVEVEIGVFVMGMKRSLQATTDENGQFSATFNPMFSESGHYTVNSGRVGNQNTAVHDDFNIPGMAVVTEGYVLCPVTQNQPKTESIRLRNKSNLPLSDIQVSVISAPEGCSINFMPLSLDGMETDDLVFTVNGTELTQGNQYQEIKLRATCNEGAETDFTIWYYCKEPRGILDVAPKNITTTMTKGTSKTIDVMLSNHGEGATGEITIDLPEVEWMSVVGSNTLPSLAVNDSAYFSLRLSPNNDIPLMQFSGNIAINCEHGEYVNLPFNITAVSESTGSLRVDVTDEYTYYSNNGPHLDNAEVTVKGYYSMETVAHGFTNTDGTFDAENLPEGYYRIHVNAERHDDYNGILLIDAGTTNQQDVFISYQTVTYDWNVTSGEIQDEYDFILNTTFETNVPAPVITIEAPEYIPDFEESYNFNYIITNHGLIDAYNAVLHTPKDDNFLFTALFDNVDTIHAQSTIVIPCMVTHLTNNTNICKHWVCSWVNYNYISGPNTIYRNAHDYTLVGTEQCGVTPPPANGGSGDAPGFGGGWGGGSGGSSLYVNNIPVVTPSGSVNVQVGVQFNQQLVMTREAFFGTFNVHNGFDTESLEAIGLNFTVKDEDGNDCTSLFQISTTSLNNITSIDGNGSLAAGLDGMAQILFIPTKEAAPTEPKVYRFGGTFTFFDPYTNNTIVCDLYPVPLTVHPSPDLYIDYFMQRDIIGDDALTLDIFEPSVPAELGVIINNKGAGVAKNVILETAEPEIVENSQGLIIDFSMYGASFNGNEAQLGLMEIPFGNIESGHTAVGEWLFTSSLLGHFVSYEAHVIHNNSYGNPNLSLVSHLDIHELIHPIRAYGNLEDGINDFLVNDVPDQNSYPDSIYFSNGGRTGVSVANSMSYDHSVTPQDTIVTLTVRPSKTGWNYGVVDDPGSGYVLVGCKRNIDNQVIPLHNVWQTFVTLRDGEEPIYENKLHFVDTLSNGRQDYTYTLIYSLNEPTSPCQINIEDELCEGDDYTMNGFNLTDLTAGTYDETLYVQNTFGYDNIVSLHLVVYEIPEVNIQIDTIHDNGISFKLTATGAEHYEWSTGETTASILVSPTEVTTYSVEGTNAHGCSDSAEVTVSVGTGVGENNQSISVDLYPNPVHDKLFVKASEPIMLVEIYTLTGNLMYKHANRCSETEISVYDFAPGIYVIRIVSETTTETKRFIVE